VQAPALTRQLSQATLMGLLAGDSGLSTSPHSSANVLRNICSAGAMTGLSDEEGLPFEAVIHFTNSDATLNLASPWKVMAPKTSTGTGFSIGSKRILTNCHVVADATSLRVFKHGVPGNYEARVLCESAVCDLALVTVDDESFWEGLPHVKFQEAVPNLDDTVCAVGYPLGATSVTLTRGVVSHVKMSDLSLTDFQEQQLTVQIDAAINPGNSGGPVFNQETGEVVGVAFSGRRDAEGMGFIIPTPVVRNFIAVYDLNGTFGRLPSLGIECQPLPNSAMRALVFGTGPKKPSHHDGILITRVDRFSCAEAAGIKAGDVLTAIDNERIGEEGDVMFRKHERVEYTYLITRKKVGDAVTLTLLRRSNTPESTSTCFDPNTLAVVKDAPKPELITLKLAVTLSPAHELLPRELKKDYHPEYAIIGGLVFIIAGLPLLEECKSRAQVSPPALALYATIHSLLEPKRDDKNKKEEPLDREAQAILCSDCLAHDINEGYQAFVGLRLEKINGVKIKNMAHLVETVVPLIEKDREPSASHAILSFFNMDHFAVFETSKLRSATPVIQKQHKIPSWTSIAIETPSSQGRKRTREE